MYPMPQKSDYQLIGFVQTDIDEEAGIIYGICMFDRHDVENVQDRYVVWRCGLQFTAVIWRTMLGSDPDVWDFVGSDPDVWDFWSGFYTNDFDRARDNFAYRGNLHPEGTFTTAFQHNESENISAGINANDDGSAEFNVLVMLLALIPAILVTIFVSQVLASATSVLAVH